MFDKGQVNMFLGVVRKYMQVRGGLSQKDLAEKIEVGESALSRFLNQKTKELDPQLIAKIVALLEVPLHEVIDFIEENSTEKFKKLVAFYKDEDYVPGTEAPVASHSSGAIEEKDAEDLFEEAFSDNTSHGEAKKSVKTRVATGRGKTQTYVFEPDNPGQSVKDKLSKLTPRQKGFISDFLNLDSEGKDLVVDLGNSIMSYFRQKGIKF